ncbi:unnamed protein product [Rhizophagus irregularis]|nr:unnamed protein product [Rhizophagus irregularis]
MEETAFDQEEFYLGEGSNLSSRRTSFLQDDNNNRPFKKQKIGRPKQSFVWNYFNTVNNINYCQVSVPISTKSPYGICNHKVENGSTTTNMINHLRKIHKIINPVEQELYKAQGQRDMRDFIVQAKPLTKDQMSFLRKKVLKFIIEDLQPFYILESNSFKELLLSLHPFFEIPTEEALDKLLDNMFEIGQTYLKNTFENADNIKENKKDGDRLERIMLSDEEWKFMETLVGILKEFEEITRILGGSKYVTLSLIYPSILKLKDFIKNTLKTYQEGNNEGNNQNINEILLNDDDIQEEILEEFEEIPDGEIADTIEINEKGSKKKLNILRSVETKGLALLFLEALEGSLKKYWSVSSDVGLLATLLDPRSKKLVRFNTTEVQKATTLLVKRYEMFMENEVNIKDKNEGENDEDKGEEDNDNNKNLDDFNLDKSLMDSIFGEEEVCEEENEVNVYLKLKPVRNINPLSWWKSNEDKFPILSKLSKEFFGISATSVPSERLFSDVGNLITNKRSSLKPEKVEKLIFLKRNAHLLDNM